MFFTDLYDFSIPRTESLLSHNLSSTNASFIKDIERFFDFTLKLNAENKVEFKSQLQKNYFENEEFLNTIIERSSTHEDSIFRLIYLIEDCENVLVLIDKELGISGNSELDPKNTWN